MLRFIALFLFISYTPLVSADAEFNYGTGYAAKSELAQKPLITSMEKVEFSTTLLSKVAALMGVAS